MPTTITSFQRGNYAEGVKIAILSNGRVKHVPECSRVGDVIQKTFEQVVESQVNVIVQPQDGDPETVTELEELKQNVQEFCNKKQKPVNLTFHNFTVPGREAIVFSPVVKKRKTRQELRDLAKQHGVKRGRNTADTIANLKQAGVKY